MSMLYNAVVGNINVSRLQRNIFSLVQAFVSLGSLAVLLKVLALVCYKLQVINRLSTLV